MSSEIWRRKSYARTEHMRLCSFTPYYMFYFLKTCKTAYIFHPTHAPSCSLLFEENGVDSDQTAPSTAYVLALQCLLSINTRLYGNFSFLYYMCFFFNNLTHFSLKIPKRVIGKHARSRANAAAAECGVLSVSPMFANSYGTLGIKWVKIIEEF